MKKTIWIIITIILIAFISQAATYNKKKQTTLVALIPLSGGNAEQGEWLRRGLDIALDEINRDRTDKIVLDYEDTQGNPKNAVSVYTDMVNRYKVPVVFTWGSGVGVTLTPLVNRDKIIQMGLATAADSYSTPSDFTFRNFPSAHLEANFLVNAFLNTLNAKQTVILKINNDYGLSSAKAFEDLYIKSGGKILVEETFEPNGTDFRTQLTKIKKTRPAFIYIASYPKEGALILKQARELGINAQFVASVAILGGKDFFDVAGTAAEGLIVANSVSVPDQDDQQSASFISTYTKRYNEAVGAQQLYATRAYDAFKIIAQAMDICNIDTECIKGELFKVKDYKGVGGSVSFDSNGDVVSNFDLQVIKNGQFTRFVH
jgi:branched-chain amino acid transport system substrate-binding protein